MILIFRRRAPGFFSWLIRLWTRSEFSHCEVVFGGANMISAVEGIGVRSVLALEPFSPKTWTTVHLPAAAGYEQKAYEWAIQELGCKYDWLGIVFCQVFKFGRQHQDKWFCSEFCTAVVQQTGLLPGVKPYRQSPGKLYRLITGVRK